MSVGEKGISRGAAISIEIAILSIPIIYLIFNPVPPLREFVVRVDRVVMDDWEMEPGNYWGRAVTKITAESMVLSGLRLDPPGVIAKNCVIKNLVVYATYNEGTVQGMTSGWAGSDVPTEALGLLLPKKNAVIENVTMCAFYQKADSMRLDGVEIRSPTHDKPLEITLPQVKMYGWEIGGPVSLMHPDGKIVDTTEISFSEVSGLLSLSWKNLKQTAYLIQKNASVYATYNKGTAKGFTGSWSGYKEPPKLKGVLGDPATITDVEQHVVYIRADEILLSGVELKVE